MTKMMILNENMDDVIDVIIVKFTKIASDVRWVL